MSALQFGEPSATIYMLCEVCGAPRCVWTSTSAAGTDVTRGLCCSADHSHGPDVPPGITPAKRLPLRVGDVLGDNEHSYCGGYFGRDAYGRMRVEAIGPDWVIARGDDGSPFIAWCDPEWLVRYRT